MDCIKRGLMVAVLMLFLVIAAIPSIAHAQDSVPIRGAKVSVEGLSTGFVTTDSNGEYVLAEGLATGVHTIVVTAPGYLDAKMGNVRVTVGQETSNINFFLKRSGAISGVVDVTPWDPEKTVLACGCCPPPYIDMLERPAFITVTQAAGTGGAPSSSSQCGKDGGSYLIYAGLSTGTYKVTAEKEGYVPATLGNVRVTEARETPNINLSIKPAGLMTGRVTTSAGMPLCGALVTAHSAKYSGSEYTNHAGYYVITKGLGEGAYTVFVQYKTYTSSRSNVKVLEQTTSPGINLMLEMPPSGSIAGVVTDGKGNAIKNALVRAGQFEARTDEDGYYGILLGAGDYTVSASAGGFYTSSSTSATVALNRQTRVNLDLEKLSSSDSGRISGQVTGEANPIPEFQVSDLPIIYALTLLVVLLATRKIRSVERWTRFS